VIAVDTSVWVSFLRGDETAAAERFVRLLEEGADVVLTDVVLTELLQGAPSDAEAAVLRARLEAFPVLRLTTLDDHALAASLHRQARRAGVTIRKTLDCLIAAPCVREDVPLLHDDADFDRLATCTALRVLPVG
jgi:hypothetical protein